MCIQFVTHSHYSEARLKDSFAVSSEEYFLLLITTYSICLSLFIKHELPTLRDQFIVSQFSVTYDIWF